MLFLLHSPRDLPRLETLNVMENTGSREMEREVREREEGRRERGEGEGGRGEREG